MSAEPFECIVFLDFDGVLNSVAWQRVRGPRPRPATLENEAKWLLDRDAVEMLNRLVDAGAAFVVSSSWRLHYTLSELRRVLAAVGFRGQLIDVTAVHSTRTAEGFYLGADRGNEIKAWLALHGDVPFIVLDDNLWPGMVNLPVVQTDDRVGLKPKDIVRALEMLRSFPAYRSGLTVGSIPVAR